MGTVTGVEAARATSAAAAGGNVVVVPRVAQARHPSTISAIEVRGDVTSYICTYHTYMHMRMMRGSRNNMRVWPSWQNPHCCVLSLVSGFVLIVAHGRRRRRMWWWRCYCHTPKKCFIYFICYLFYLFFCLFIFGSLRVESFRDDFFAAFAALFSCSVVAPPPPPPFFAVVARIRRQRLFRLKRYYQTY